MKVAARLEAAGPPVRFASEATGREPQFPAQLIEIMAAAIRQLAALEQVPDPLVTVQVERVAGQPFRMEPTRLSS